MSSYRSIFLIANLVVGLGLFGMAGVSLVLADDGLPVGVTSVASSLKSGGGSSFIMSSVRMFGGLFLCLGVLAIGLRIYQRYHPMQSPALRRIEIREKVAISSKAAVMLITVDDREFLVASGSDAVSMLPLRTAATDMFSDSLNELCREDEVVSKSEVSNG